MLPQDPPCPLEDPNLRPAENVCPIPALAGLCPTTLFLQSPYPSPGASHAPIFLANTNLLQSPAQTLQASGGLPATQGTLGGHSRSHVAITSPPSPPNLGAPQGQECSPQCQNPSSAPCTHAPGASEVYLGIMKYRTQTSHCAWYKALPGQGSPEKGLNLKKEGVLPIPSSSPLYWGPSICTWDLR